MDFYVSNVFELVKATFDIFTKSTVGLYFTGFLFLSLSTSFIISLLRFNNNK